MSWLPLALFLAATTAKGASGLQSQESPKNQPPVFGAEVNSVFVDVFVTEKDRSVQGLVARDFVLRDEGIAQPFELVSADSLPIRVVLAFDISGSVAGVKLERLQGAARKLIEDLRPQDEIGVVAFSEQVTWPATLSSDRAAARRALESLNPRGATAVYDGLFSALMTPRSALRTLVVLFSDGEDNMSWISQARLRKLVERFNSLIYVVAARSEDFTSGDPRAASVEASYTKFLKEISEMTGGSLIEVRSADRIATAFSQIMETMRTRYVLRYDPEGAPAKGWHRLDVKLKTKAKAEVRGRSGYWVQGR